MRTRKTNNIGFICGRYRAGAGITQVKLAEMTNTLAPNIAAMERGHTSNMEHLTAYLQIAPNSPKEKVFIEELVEALRNGIWSE